MYIPSARVVRQMNAESNNTWFLPSKESTPVVLIKGSTTVLKSIVQGCAVDLLFGMDKSKQSNYLCTGTKIQDSTDVPIFLYGLQNHQEEHQALQHILQTGKARIFLFNELDMCVAWTDLTLQRKEADKALDLINDFSKLCTGALDIDGNHFLDCVGYTLDETASYTNVYKISHIFVPTKLGQWTYAKIIRVGQGGSGKFNLGDLDEGGSFEETIWSSLEGVFPMKIHRRPCVLDGKKERELTDILSFYKYGTFLIEAKALSSFTSKDRSLETKTKNVKKDAKKAIKQLLGAVKKIREEAIIKDQSGQLLSFDRNIPPHCIILVSELFNSGDWSEVKDEMLKAMKKGNVFFHILDFSDFVMYLKRSQGRVEILDYNLIERAKVFAKEKTVHIRGKF